MIEWVPFSYGREGCVVFEYSGSRRRFRHPRLRVVPVEVSTSRARRCGGLSKPGLGLIACLDERVCCTTHVMTR